MSKYSIVLQPFMALMAAELAANSHKGDRAGWLKMTKWQALGEVKHHHQKLDVAVAEGNRGLIIEHAADVANCAMMVLDVMGLLELASIEPKKDGPVVGYLHRLHTECGDITRFSDSSTCPFGRKGHDYDPSYSTSYKKLVEVE